MARVGWRRRAPTPVRDARATGGGEEGGGRRRRACMHARHLREGLEVLGPVGAGEGEDSELLARVEGEVVARHAPLPVVHARVAALGLLALLVEGHLHACDAPAVRMRMRTCIHAWGAGSSSWKGTVGSSWQSNRSPAFSITSARSASREWHAARGPPPPLRPPPPALPPTPPAAQASGRPVRLRSVWLPRTSR